MTVPKTVHPAKPKTLPKSLGFSRYALDFDGAEDYVNVPYDATLDLDGAMSILTWIYPRNIAADGEGIVTHRAENVDTNYNFVIRQDGLRYDFYGTDAAWHSILTPVPNPLTENTWNHIAVTRDTGGVVKIYVNGDRKVSSDEGVVSNTYNYPVHIGRSHQADDFFDGKMTDLCIYSRALSANEIQGTMLNYHNPPKNGLEGWWRFEEGTGLTAHDRSGNGNDGDLLPAATPPTWRDVKKWELRAGGGL